jgi:hypothetical protein
MDHSVLFYKKIIVNQYIVLPILLQVIGEESIFLCYFHRPRHCIYTVQFDAFKLYK